MSDELVLIAGSGDGTDSDNEQWAITDVLTHYGWSGRSGRMSGAGWRRIDVCPFHGGDGGAAYSEYHNAFLCYGCDMRGNSVTLVMRQENLEANDAVEWLRRNIDSDATPRTPHAKKKSSLPWEWDGMQSSQASTPWGS